MPLLVRKWSSRLHAALHVTLDKKSFCAAFCYEIAADDV